MYIKHLHIGSFGALVEKDITFERGLNIIEGENESGKSTVAMFIKFMLYGLSAKAVGKERISEREHYVNWNTGVASGWMTVESEGEEFRIDRRITLAEDLNGREEYKESVKLTKLATGEAVKGQKSPGEFFFGFPEKVFMQSAFVKNISSTEVDNAGLKVAVENLLSSGDEEINTKRALEKLDAARKLLLHKNGLGGTIAELTAEKKELDGLLERSKDSASEIVDLEGTLSDLTVKISSKDGEYAELSELCRGYEAVRNGSRVKEIKRCEGDIAFLQSELDSLDPAVDRQFLAKIELCESNVRDTEKDISVLEEKRSELEEKCEGRKTEEPPEAEEVAKKYGKIRHSAAFLTALGATCIPLSAALLALVWVKGAAIGSFLLPAVVAGVAFLPVGICFLLLGILKRKSARDMLSSFGAADEAELRAVAEEEREQYRYTAKLLEKMARIDAVTEEAVGKHDREIENGYELAKLVGIETGETVFDVLSAARVAAEEICARRETMVSKKESAKGRLSALLEEVGDIENEEAEKEEKLILESELGEKILRMTKEDYSRSIRERDFAKSTADAMRLRSAEIEKRLAVLKAAGDSPAKIASQISCLERKISELTFKHRALVLAYDSLLRAGEKMRGDVMPKVAAKAAKIMDRVTYGRYADIGANEDMELSFVTNGERRDVDFLSEGTKDAAYVSLRAALVDVMYSGSTPPLIFDECFARMDRQRLCRIMQVLDSEGMPQCAVFSCRDLEAAAVPDANVIRLER